MNIISTYIPVLVIMETGENQSLLNRRESRDTCIRCCRSCCVGCVCSKGILLLLTWSVLIHSFGYYLIFQLLANFFFSFKYYFVAVSVVQAIVFILYPVAGLLGEVCFSRKQIMIAATILSMIGIVIAVPTGTVTFYKYVFSTYYFTDTSSYFLLVAVCVGLVIYQFGLGLFESNAIQFGTDQLQFASNDKLSVFVNWYFWSMYFIKVLLLVSFSFLLLSPFGIAILGGLSFILICITLFCCCCGCHRNLTTEPVSHVNPVKHIFKVLNYARHHSQPVFRSAFTYGEVPSRLDLAKNRYGGPFTTEEVEDVKTFGRILLVLTSLFGFLLLPNTLWSSELFFFDFEVGYFYNLYLPNIQSILPVLLIPVHMLIIRPCFNRYIYRISILNKMGAGLVLVVMSLGLMTAVDISLYNVIESVNFSSYIFFENLDPPDYILSFIILTQILNGLSLILISLSALEFILAQGPRSMQGLLIGLWYAYQSVSVLFQIPAQRLHSLPHFHYWLTVLETCLAVVSLIVFIIISRWYKYRQREESSEINRQAIIEEYTERQLITDRESFDYDNEYNYLRNYSYRTVQ